ncbi:flagellar hook capping FlgD N-terminal domain-containing protein [Roseisalinus antarcticus]|uniref:Basal-body rod modification protein FlgD n=1 Tax=Roseisalinus antarcticus TaxID=254357 RepID=A0A1Y5TGJ1_9RHOB|nr:flagellar hook capping FlgD N-terminal domain-containing protein [Roseisalinus antarcticus]SLN63233.1 flagellar basal body rod modification protein [Roseisalinus antarcticus]
METTSPTGGQTAVQAAFAASANQRSSETQEAGGQPTAPAISSDFETFLKMLTVQMENQDPLNPVDSSDYAVQLATFSGVEQQVLTNDLLKGLGQALGMSGLNQIAGWVGQRAPVTAPVQFENAPMTVVADTVSYADRAELVVRSADGMELERHEIAPPGGEVGWAPAEGAPAALEPVYFEVESFSAGTSLGAEPAPVYAPVREVRMADGVPSIVLPGGQTLPASGITALRQG